MRREDEGAAGGRGGPAAGRVSFEAAFERSFDPMLLCEGEIVTDANPAACALLGLQRSQVVGQSFNDLCRPEEKAEARSTFASLLYGGGGRGEVELVCGDGCIRRVECAATASVQPNVHLFILRDITERKRREVMSERYELLTRHARDIVLFIDKRGIIVEANEAAFSAYGYAREELLGMHIRELRAEDTRDLIPAQMEEAFAKGILFESVHLRKNGTTFPVEIGSRAALIGCERMLLSIVRDLSERAEMHANLLHADRLAAVGTLAAGVAHEINNPLAYAMGNLDMLARRLPDAIARLRTEAMVPQDDAAPSRLLAITQDLVDAERMLAVAREGAARVRTIVLDLRRFSRPDEAMVGPVDVRDVLEYAIGIAASEIRHRARMVRDYGEIPLVVINESRLGQVILNILVNAAQAIPEGRAGTNEIHVRTTTDERGHVVIEIADTGVGIAPSLVGRVFDPFVTTKPVGEGTGLGLFISRAIVKQAGGEIVVQSELGEGTTVRITLPPAPSSSSIPAHAPALVTTRPPPTPRRRLLVIDDEPALATMVRAMLSSAHDIVVADSGRDALARLSSDPGFDAVLCDLMMPDLSGMDLFEIVARALPELAPRFVFMTGGAFTPRAEDIYARFPDRCLEKPFEASALLALLDRLGPRGEK
jgi:PAS domain S-box-containing protein